MSSVRSTARGDIKEKCFNPDEDAAALRKAIEGSGTDEKIIIDILTQRSNVQRQLICQAYENSTGRTLRCDLEGDTSGDLKDILVALITPAMFDCHEFKRAIQGAGTDESILIEIFASRSNNQIKAMSDAYLAETKRSLIDDLKSEVSGYFKETLVLLAKGKRDESTNVDATKAKQDAKILYEAGEQKWGTDESKFIDILCNRSFPQLRQTLVEYKTLTGKTLQESIESEMSGNLEGILVAIVKCVRSVPAYFAECLYKSMKGAGTTESTLTRIIVSRSEIDLQDIKAEYKKMFSCSLQSALESETSGDFCKTLLKICGEDV